MSGFGGAVKLTGESEYRKALSQITQSLRVVSAEMKATSSSFALGDKSQDDLAQSSKQLSDALDTQKTALSSLKTQLATMQGEYNKTGARHQELVQKYDAEKAKLEQIKATLGTSSQEYKEQEKVVAELATEVQNSQKAYDAQGKALNDMKIKTANAETTVNQTAQALEHLGDSAEESAKDAKNAGDGFTVFKGVLANLTAQAITGAVNALKNLAGALVDVGKQSVQNYADYEQLVGGIETLFGAGGMSVEEYAKSVGKSVSDVQGEYDNLIKAQENVLKDANEAYKTAGLSANEYMELTTAVSASMIQSLDGDTVKASEKASMAITDMADNANKMGKPIQDIQNAYTAFSRGQFQLLDNLSLGYGGTKTEMERLLKDAEAISGVHYDISSYADIVDAIHVVQNEMGITGTTAKEASETISGSTAMMKASWQNMLTGMADENADFETLSGDLIDSVVAVAKNIIPRVTQVITGLSSAIQTALPKLVGSVLPMVAEAVPTIIQAILTTVLVSLPELINAGVQITQSLFEGISEAIPELIAMLPEVINAIVTTLLNNISLIITAGIDLLLGIIQGLTEALPQLVDYIPVIVQTTVTVLMENLPILISGALQLFLGIVTGLVQMIPSLVNALPQVVTAVVKGLTEPLTKRFKDMWKKVKDVFKPARTFFHDTFASAWTAIKGVFANWSEFFGGLWTKIRNKFTDIGTSISDAISGSVRAGLNSVLASIENIINKGVSMINGAIDIINKIPKVNIGHLSELALPRLAKGGVITDETVVAGEKGAEAIVPLENNTGWIRKVAGELKDNLSPNSLRQEAVRDYDLVQDFKQALSEMKIVLDDEVAGEFVERTVTRVIYT